MSRWLPLSAEERWLDVASELGTAVPRAAVAERTGGWRSTGPLARVALFILGLVAAVLLFAILGVGQEANLLVAGLIAVLAGEWLTVAKRLYASGIEEGLCLAGFLLIGAWITTLTDQVPEFAGGSADTLVLIAAAGVAGLRRLNPFVTTCAVIALVYWVGSTGMARAFDHVTGGGLIAVAFGCALAALALVLGARTYLRPSHDRLLDWMNDTRDPFRGYYWERRPWRSDARPATWNYTNMTRQREETDYEPRQLDYLTGLEMTAAVRKK